MISHWRFLLLQKQAGLAGSDEGIRRPCCCLIPKARYLLGNHTIQFVQSPHVRPWYFAGKGIEGAEGRAETGNMDPPQPTFLSSTQQAAT